MRQALDRLREDQLVDSIRGSGTYVKSEAGPDGRHARSGPARRVGHILEGLELRMVIEPECAHLAALRRTPEDLQGGNGPHADRLRRGRRIRAPSPTITTTVFHRAIAVMPPATKARFVQVLKSLEYDVSHAVNVMRHLVHSEPWKRTRAAIDEHRHIYTTDPRSGCRGRPQRHARPY